MANRFVRALGGSYSSASTWASTSGGVDSVAVPTASDDVFLDALSGQLTIDAASVAKSVDCTGYTGTLTHNGFTLTVSGSVTFVAGMTYTTVQSSKININVACTLTTGGKLLPSISMQSGAGLTLGDNYQSNAYKDTYLALSTNGMDLNGKTISGNSATNRLLINSNTLGVARTITVNSGTFANADFRDITFSSASNLDLSAITGLSGDCGGNSITGGGTVLTFTTAVDQHWISASGGNWSDVTKWTSRIPLPQDNVFFDNAFSASQTVTADMPRLGKSIDWTGATGTPTLALTSIGNTQYGSLTLISGMTLTHTQTLNFEGRGSFTLTSAGKSFASVTIAMFGGTLTLQDALTSTNTITLNNGTFVDNGFSISISTFSSSNSNVRTITKTGSWTLTGTGTLWTTATATNLTLSDSGTISITNISATSKTFNGGGLTYNNISITGGGTGAVIFTGANTFNKITVAGGTKTITLPGSTTTTLISGDGLENGTNVITFNASAGSATISKTSGVLSWDYISLTNIPSTGGATFYAGTNSVDGGGNTGWNFVDAPPSGLLTMNVGS